MLKDSIYMRGVHVVGGRISSTELKYDRREAALMLYIELKFSRANAGGWYCSETYIFKMSMPDLGILLDLIGVDSVRGLGNLALSVEYRFVDHEVEYLSVKTTVGGAVLCSPKDEKEPADDETH